MKKLDKRHIRLSESELDALGLSYILYDDWWMPERLHPIWIEMGNPPERMVTLKELREERGWAGWGTGRIVVGKHFSHLKEETLKKYAQYMSPWTPAFLYGLRQSRALSYHDGRFYSIYRRPYLIEAIQEMKLPCTLKALSFKEGYFFNAKFMKVLEGLVGDGIRNIHDNPRMYRFKVAESLEEIGLKDERQIDQQIASELQQMGIGGQFVQKICTKGDETTYFDALAGTGKKEESFGRGEYLHIVGENRLARNLWQKEPHRVVGREKMEMLAGIIAGGIIRENTKKREQKEEYIIIPRTEWMLKFLDSFPVIYTPGIYGEEYKGATIRLSPFYGALCSIGGYLPDRLGLKMLSFRHPAACPLLPRLIYEVTVGGAAPLRANSLPYGCSIITCKRKGWTKKHLRKMAVYCGVTHTCMEFRDIILGYLERGKSLHGMHVVPSIGKS